MARCIFCRCGLLVDSFAGLVVYSRNICANKIVGLLSRHHTLGMDVLASRNDINEILLQKQKK